MFKAQINLYMCAILNNLMEYEIIEKMPEAQRPGRTLSSFTLELIRIIKDNKGKIIKLPFTDKKRQISTYYRIKDMQKKKRVDFKRLARRGNDLLIQA